MIATEIIRALIRPSSRVPWLRLLVLVVALAGCGGGSGSSSGQAIHAAGFGGHLYGVVHKIPSQAQL